MEIFYKKIITISGLLTISFLFFFHYNLLRKIPGFYCEGFGCTGQSFWYIQIAILMQILVFVIGYLIAEDKKWQKAFKALGISIVFLIIIIVIQSAWNNINLNRAIHEAEIAEGQFWKEVKQNEEIIKNDKLEEEENLKQVIELSQNEIVDKKLGSEFLTTGVVVDHNLEDVNILDGYVQIKLDINKRDAFVIYNPYKNGKQIDCMNKINTDLVVGDAVEVRGVTIKELNSVEPVEMLISTCESSEYYIKKI